MNYEDITMWRSGAEWQAIDPAHGCKYCKNRVETKKGLALCALYCDALQGFSFAGDIPSPDICDDYELDHAAFWAGEKRSPDLEEIVPGRQPGGEPLPVVGR